LKLNFYNDLLPKQHARCDDFLATKATFRGSIETNNELFEQKHFHRSWKNDMLQMLGEVS